MKSEYLELSRLIERLHRLFLDVLRAELNRLGVKDINAVQVLLLANVGEEEIVIRDLIERGYYQGSNVSYNIKKLTELGYLDQERTPHDRRSVTVRLTPKALDVVKNMRQLEDRRSAVLAEQMEAGEAGTVCRSLRQLERLWTEYIRYGRR